MKATIKKIKQVLKRYPEVLFAYIFGSYVRANIGPTSDIDIALFFDHKLSAEKQNRIEESIELEILQALNLSGDDKIHIAVLNNIGFSSPFLEQEIVYKGKLIDVKNDAQRAHYEAQAIHRWLDWQPHQEKFNQATAKNLGKPIQSFKVYA